MITQEQFEGFLALTHEIPAVEFKGSGSRKDNPLFGKVVRAAMGMANRRDGGFVIIGVSDHNGVLSTIGLTSEQLATWRHDDIADGLAAHADPPISFDSAAFESNGMKFVVLKIHEFTEIPIVCKQEYKDNSNPNIPIAQRPVILRKGAFYIRRRHKAETAEISSAEDMRALLDLAVEKGVSKRSGLSLSGSSQPSHQELFEQQLNNWANPLVEKIRSRGYWEVTIRPNKFIEERIPEIITLYPFMQKTSVNLRSWDFPHTGWGMEYEIGNDWVGQEYEEDWICEAWRFYQSCQFVHISGIMEDWRDQSKWHPVQEGWKPGVVLSVEGVVYRFTEIFEFASHLALSHEQVFDEKIQIEIQMSGLRGRQLDLNSTRWLPFFDRYVASEDTIPFLKELSKEDLIAQPRELALQAATRLFQRFKWNPSKELLKDIQARLGQSLQT